MHTFQTDNWQGSQRAFTASYKYSHTSLLWATQNSQTRLPSPPNCFNCFRHFLNLIEELSHLPPNALLVTADNTYLYTNMPHKDSVEAVVDFMEECNHLLPTNCPPPLIVHTILDFTPNHSTLKFMDMHIHQILGASLCQSIHGKERTHHNPNFSPPNLLLETFHWCYFLHFPGLPLPTQMLDDMDAFTNTISHTIKYTFTYF